MGVLLLGLAGAFAVFAPSSRADAESCSYDPIARSVTATIADGGEATLELRDGALWFGDGEADTQIAGSGGVDTAYYDAAVDSAPISTAPISIEHKFPS